MSVRGKKKGLAFKNEDGAEDEYDNEEDVGDTYGDEDDQELEVESIYLFSQQPDEVFDIIMNPDYKELLEYLRRDDEYNWVYLNPQIKK